MTSATAAQETPTRKARTITLEVGAVLMFVVLGFLAGLLAGVGIALPRSESQQLKPVSGVLPSAPPAPTVREMNFSFIGNVTMDMRKVNGSSGGNLLQQMASVSRLEAHEVSVYMRQTVDPVNHMNSTDVRLVFGGDVAVYWTDPLKPVMGVTHINHVTLQLHFENVSTKAILDALTSCVNGGGCDVSEFGGA